MGRARLSALRTSLEGTQIGGRLPFSYRRDEIYRPKPQNIERIETAIAEGAVEFLPETNLTEIREESVVYRDAEDETHTLPTDAVFIFIGGVLPTDMIENLGGQIDTKFGEPVSAP